MEEEKTEEKKEQEYCTPNPHKKNMTKKLRENPWILSTFVFGIIMLLLITGSLFGGITGNVVSSNNAGENLVKYLNTVADSEVTLIKVEESQNMYKATIEFKGQEIPVYVTKDGQYYTMSLLPLTSLSSSTQTQQDMPKSDTPKVELFIWSYCPYGVQAQTPFAQVASLLKNNADFEIVPYYNGHGEHETQQNKIEACIQKLDKDKYWDYSEKFVENIYPKCGSSRDVDCNEQESITLMKSLGIDSEKIMSCVETQGETLLKESSARAKELGVTGSPTIVINGVKASPSSRTAEAFKDSVCSAFNNVPEECGTTLDSSTTTASGNC